ncbi:predicted protein [Aspergillus terreus NIH2624]|uniref:Uncharacterized protein n=1 Tax=Aspergillus terreus (strain NIH 2624 / FGSC A1156) TaxID=341663 RepID=Q0CUU9_ASPTN|nr:uncharacterized protein ATEG_02535 [Aspergillus terreus NIH2624]EAU37497.1 predicted protein [Aspergillus terreus NIH2624]
MPPKSSADIARAPYRCDYPGFCSPANANPPGACAKDNNVQMKHRPVILEPGPKASLSDDPKTTAVKPPRWIAHDYVDIYFKEFHPKWPFLHRDDEYELLVALVQSCRLGGIFSYPNMLTHHSDITTPALLWGGFLNPQVFYTMRAFYLTGYDMSDEPK